MHGQQNIKIITICISSEALGHLMFMVQVLCSCVSVSVLGSHRTACGVAVPLWDFRTVFKIRFYLRHTAGIMARVDIMEPRGITVLFIVRRICTQMRHLIMGLFKTGLYCSKQRFKPCIKGCLKIGAVTHLAHTRLLNVNTFV